MVEVCPVNERQIIEGPKRFAARIGLVLSVLTVVFYLANLHLIAFILAGILVFFTFLEAAFGFCKACKIYPIFFRNTIVNPS